MKRPLVLDLVAILFASLEAASLREEILATRKLQDSPMWNSVLSAAESINAGKDYSEKSSKGIMYPLGYSVLPGMSGQRFLSAWWINHPDRQLAVRIGYTIDGERSEVNLTALDSIGMFGRWIKGITFQVPMNSEGDIESVTLAISRDGIKTEVMEMPPVQSP